jgi:hypothetical protein
MNWGRIIGGGLIAGLIINITEFLVNGLFLQNDWAAAMAALGKPAAMGTGAIVAFNVWGFLTGIGALWLYAAIRPRFGAGPATAIKAALAMWFTNYFLGSIAAIATDVFPMKLVAIGLVVGIVEVIAATLAGARIYTETETLSARAAGAR